MKIIDMSVKREQGENGREHFRFMVEFENGEQFHTAVYSYIDDNRGADIQSIARTLRAFADAIERMNEPSDG